MVVGGPKGTFSTTSTSAAVAANDVDLGGSFDDRPSVEGLHNGLNLYDYEIDAFTSWKNIFPMNK